MESIERFSSIEKSKLSGEHYFQSLLEQAYTFGMLSDTDIETIQFHCLSILARQTERYNSGDSSSIRVETAQNIMTSIMFTISIWLKTLHSPDDAVLAIQNDRVDDLYQKGCKCIDTMVRAAKALHSEILGNLVDTKNVFYRSTIADGIKGFFKLYYPDFGAHEIHITADYPVYNPMEKLAGIEFIYKYLENIYFENLFCSNFMPEDIHHLLCGYNEEYQDLLFNIYEPILTTSMGCVLSGADVHRLDISLSALNFLNHLFTGKTKKEIEKILLQAVVQLKEIFSLSQSVEKYIESSLQQISTIIENAVCTKTLDKIFIIAKYPEKDPKLYFSFGDKMDNELYRKVIDEIMQCSVLADKIDVIKEYTHSLADLEDILLDANLSTSEIQVILRQLSSTEIVALVKRYSNLSDMCDISTVELRESEKTLYECLCNFIDSLSKEQQAWMDKAIKALNIE